jgi:hypothetical protein
VEPANDPSGTPAISTGAMVSAEQRIGYGRPELDNTIVCRFRSKTA